MISMMDKRIFQAQKYRTKSGEVQRDTLDNIPTPDLDPAAHLMNEEFRGLFMKAFSSPSRVSILS